MLPSLTALGKKDFHRSVKALGAHGHLRMAEYDQKPVEIDPKKSIHGQDIDNTR